MSERTSAAHRPLACPRCEAFVEAVIGIRGPNWKRRRRRDPSLPRSRRANAGQSHRYVRTDRYGELVAPTSADERVILVTPSFYHHLERGCRGWLRHYDERAKATGDQHWRALPFWLRSLVPPYGFGRKIPNGQAVDLAANILGIGRRTFQRQRGTPREELIPLERDGNAKPIPTDVLNLLRGVASPESPSRTASE